MKKQNIKIKTIIKKRIENNNIFFIGNKKMNERDLRRINGGSNNLKSLSCNEKQNNDLRQINSPIEPEKLILKTVSKYSLLTNKTAFKSGLTLKTAPKSVIPDKEMSNFITSEATSRDGRRNTTNNLSIDHSTSLSRDERRTGHNVQTLLNNSIYQIKAFVDYDVVICIPSYNRYEKVKRLISQFYSQTTKYRFKIILLNDGSTDNSYNDLIKEFPQITYLSNKTPNGKTMHWYCYNQMWSYLKNIEYYTVLQMDDDFILSKNFLNNILDLYFKLKQENNTILAISPHLWSFNKKSNHEMWWDKKDFVDGIALIDESVISSMKYEMKKVDVVMVSKPGIPVRTWIQISEAIVKMGGIIYRTQNSLVYHDGNDDSKLHGDVRKKGKNGVYTQKYIEKL